MKTIHVDNDSSLEEFNNLVNGSNMMVLYYMPGCGHCEALKPEWEKFENDIADSSKDVIVAKIRSDYLGNVNCDKDIMGYPTIYELKDGKKVREFEEDRNSEELTKFFNQVGSSMNGGSRRKAKRSLKRKSRKNKSTKSKKLIKKTLKNKSRKHKKGGYIYGKHKK